jgi:rubredoxin
MSLETEQECPECEAVRTFWKTGTTEIHLGTKRKWRCSECGFGFVRIDGAVDTGVVRPADG